MRSEPNLSPLITRYHERRVGNGKKLNLETVRIRLGDGSPIFDHPKWSLDFRLVCLRERTEGPSTTCRDRGLCDRNDARHSGELAIRIFATGMANRRASFSASCRLAAIKEGDDRMEA